MDPLYKLDLILSSLIAQKKREIQIGTAKGIMAYTVYLNGIENQIKGYQESLSFVRQLKETTPGCPMKLC